MKLLYQFVWVAGLTLGATVVGLLVGIGAGFIYSKTVARVEPRLPRPWGFTNEGEPFLFRHARQSDPPDFIHYADTVDKLPLEEIGFVDTDLNGKPLAEAHPTEGITLPGDPYSPARPWFSWSKYQKSFQNYSESWDLVWEGGPNGSGYFAGYDKEAKRQIGFIGSAGLRNQPPPREEWFALQGYQAWESRVKSSRVRLWEVLNCGSQVFHVNFNSREVRSLFEHLPAPARSVAVTPENYPTLVGWAAQSVVVRTDAALCLVDLDGKGSFASSADAHERTIPIPPLLQNRTFTIFKRRDGGLTVDVDNRSHSGDELQLQSSIYVLAADGTLGPPREVAWGGVRPSPPRVLFWPLCSPLAQGVSALFFDRVFFDDYDGATTWFRYAAKILWPEGVSLATILALAIALAALCYRRESRRQASLGGRIMWPVFVLLFGVPGWIGYRFGLRRQLTPQRTSEISVPSTSGQ